MAFAVGMPIAADAAAAGLRKPQIGVQEELVNDLNAELVQKKQAYLVTLRSEQEADRALAAAKGTESEATKEQELAQAKQATKSALASIRSVQQRLKCAVTLLLAERFLVENGAFSS